MARRKTGRVAFAIIEVESATISDLDSLAADSLVPGKSISRYGREWRMGAVSRLEVGVWAGRIGFQRTTGSGEIWNDKVGDFMTVPIIEGKTSPFVLDLRRRDVAYQLRPGVIKRQSFTGAFEQLLNEGVGWPAWAVVPQLDEMTFAEWQGSVDRIDSIHFKLELPNPNWEGREDLGQVMSEFDAALLEITAKADPDDPDGIDLSTGLPAQAVAHVEREYGTFKATGKVDGLASTFDSATDSAPPERQVTEVNPETGEVTYEQLRDALDDIDADATDSDGGADGGA
jgi:hypothetical protein